MNYFIVKCSRICSRIVFTLHNLNFVQFCDINKHFGANRYLDITIYNFAKDIQKKKASLYIRTGKCLDITSYLRLYIIFVLDMSTYTNYAQMAILYSCLICKNENNMKITTLHMSCFLNLMVNRKCKISFLPNFFFYI